MTTHYNLENIRTLLTEGFSDEQLRSFCFDHPDFRPIYSQLAAGTGKSQIVHRLVEHADRRELFGPLLAWAEEQNPVRYKKHQPYYSASAPTISSSGYGKSKRTLSTTTKISIISILIAIVIGIATVCATLISPFLPEWFRNTPAPITGTTVFIHVFDRDSGIFIPRANVLLFADGERLVGVTDNTGTSKFEIPFLDGTGEVDLVVEKANYAIERLNNIQPRDKKIDVLLRQREGDNADVIFLVTNETEASVPGAKVVLLVEDDILSQITDSNGIVKFTIAFLEDKIDAKVRVEALGYEPDDQNMTLSLNKVQGIRLSPDSGFQPVPVFTPETPTAFDGPTATLTLESPTPTVTLMPAGTSTPTNTPSPIPTPLGGGGRIAFVSARNQNKEIYVINPDGSDARNLTNHPADDLVPSWSPDGTHITFTSNREGSFEVYVMNADGSNVVRLTNTSPAESRDPNWSSDGTRIAFISNQNDGVWRIWVMNVDGSDPTVLTNTPAGDWAPSWSPDGERIAFASNRDAGIVGKGEIYVMNADGNNQTNLTNNSVLDSVPHWSPDGTRIAFYSERDDNRELYVMNNDGSQVTRLTNHTGMDFLGTWSPDGLQITFTSDRDGNLEIYRMNADGSGAVRLTNNSAEDSGSAWSWK